MLTATLRQLEANGLIKRKVYPTVPPKVEYKLTESGLEILAMIEKIDFWAKDNRVMSKIRRFRS
jgi:DNA-binding HxlR family transcriptional regulator